MNQDFLTLLAIVIAGVVAVSSNLATLLRGNQLLGSFFLFYYGALIERGFTLSLKN